MDAEQDNSDVDGLSESELRQRRTAETILLKAQHAKEEMLEGVAKKQNFLDVQEEEMEMIVKRVDRSTQRKKVAREKIESAFEITVEDMKRMGERSRKRSLCQLVFCSDHGM